MTKSWLPLWLAPLFTRKMGICVLTGFASGLPLFLLLNLVQAWLTTEKIDIKDIGLFALIQLPYTCKFLWAPFLDAFLLPWLGRRRSWMLVCQLVLIALIAALGHFSPRQGLFEIAVVSVALAFFSATLDIAIDAFRREMLETHELGLGNVVHVNAYRIASLVPGSLALILAAHLPWQSVFYIVALFMLPGVVMTLMVSEPALAASRPKNLEEAVVQPFREFINRAGWQMALWVLGFIFLYKLGDSLCTALATTFYLKMGFRLEDIGLVAKHAGLWPSIIGGLLGGLWMIRLEINRALWVFGVLQAVSVLGFFGLALLGPAEPTFERLLILAGVVGFEAFGVGLGTAAFVAYIASNTHKAYTATQFALFTSLAAVPRTLINSTAGWLVERLGWPGFFLLCTALTVPGMLLLFKVAPWNGRVSHAGEPVPVEQGTAK